MLYEQELHTFENVTCKVQTLQFKEFFYIYLKIKSTRLQFGQTVIFNDLILIKI